MYTQNFSSGRRFALLAGLWILLSVAMAGYALAKVQRPANVRHDATACESFGARYGSPQYAECMRIQQRRRATGMGDATGRQRASAPWHASCA